MRRPLFINLQLDQPKECTVINKIFAFMFSSSFLVANAGIVDEELYSNKDFRVDFQQNKCLIKSKERFANLTMTLSGFYAVEGGQDFCKKDLSGDLELNNQSMQKFKNAKQTFEGILMDCVSGDRSKKIYKDFLGYSYTGASMCKPQNYINQLTYVVDVMRNMK